MQRVENEEISMTGVLTLVLWLACLGVGIPGLQRQAVRLTAMETARRAVTIDVDTVHTIAPNISERASPLADGAPQEIAPADVPRLPNLPAPNSPPAFAKPMDLPLPKLQTQVSAPPQSSTPVAAVQQLTFGEGAGDQPPPEYPREAVLEGQEGTVVVLFTVDQDGRVTEAKASTPCRWPLLNNAAVQAVRETWHLPPGRYQVSIEFQLQK